MVSGFRAHEFKAPPEWPVASSCHNNPRSGGGRCRRQGGRRCRRLGGARGRGWAGAGLTGRNQRKRTWRHGRDYARLGLLLCVAFSSPFGERPLLNLAFRTLHGLAGPFAPQTPASENFFPQHVRYFSLL